MGLKNASTASTRFGQIKRKLAEKFGNVSPTTPAGSKSANASDKSASAVKAQKAGGGRKRKAEDDGTPTKRGRAAKSAKIVKAEEVKGEDEDDVAVVKKEVSEANGVYDYE